MYHVVFPMRCSKCGSTHSETFSRNNGYQSALNGRRCLDCNHEVIESKLTWAGEPGKAYVLTAADNVF